MYSVFATLALQQKMSKSLWIYLFTVDEYQCLYNIFYVSRRVACLALLTYQFGFYQTDSWHIAKSLSDIIVGCLPMYPKLKDVQIFRHTIDLFTLQKSRPQLLFTYQIIFYVKEGAKKININSFTNDRAIEILQIRIITNTRAHLHLQLLYDLWCQYWVIHYIENICTETPCMDSIDISIQRKLQ